MGTQGLEVRGQGWRRRTDKAVAPLLICYSHNAAFRNSAPRQGKKTLTLFFPLRVYLASTHRPAGASCFSAAGVSAGTALTSDPSLCTGVCVRSLQRRVPVVSPESFRSSPLFPFILSHFLLFLCVFLSTSSHRWKKKNSRRKRRKKKSHQVPIPSVVRSGSKHFKRG